MANWLEHTAQIEVNAPISLVWDLWSDLEQLPHWMKWIESVEVMPDNPELSRWKLTAAGGLEFSWLARRVKVIPQQLLQCESVDGLPNRAAIRFYDHGSKQTTVKMTIAYSIPGFLGELLDNLFIGRIVESTLNADLERFRDYIIKAQTTV